MKKLITVFALALALVLIPTHNLNAQGNGGNISVIAQTLYDGNGHGYGVKFYLSSSVDEPTCVYPYLDQTNSYNVNGGLGGSAYPLGAGEQNVFIGQYNQADPDQAWQAIVQSKWQTGSC